MLRITNLTGFGGSGTLDTTDPTITSDATGSVDGNVALAFTITVDESCTIAITGGADASEFELASPGAISTTHVLRWSSNGTRDHGSPSDADVDNVYEVEVTATDLSGNVSTPQTIEITVDQNWVTTFGPYSLSNEGFNSGQYTIRQLVPASLLSVSGSHVRLLLEAPQLLNCTIDAVYIGERASSGDAYDMKSSTPSPTQFLFSGSGSFTFAGEDVYSDDLTFAIDETKDYVVTMHVSTVGSWSWRYATGATGAQGYYKNSVNEAATANVTGYGTLSTNSSIFVKKMSVY